MGVGGRCEFPVGHGGENRLCEMEVLQFQCCCLPSHPGGRRVAARCCSSSEGDVIFWLAFNALPRRSSDRSWLLFLSRPEVKEAAIALAGDEAGQAHTDPSPC